MPLSSASRSVRNSFTLAGTPARRTVKKKSNSTAASGLDEELQARERRLPELLLPRDRGGALQLAVLERDLALARALGDEAHVHRRAVAGPRDPHRLAARHAADFQRSIGGEPARAHVRVAPRVVKPADGNGDGLRRVRREARGLLVHRAQPARLLVTDRHHLAPPAGDLELAMEELRDLLVR